MQHEHTHTQYEDSEKTLALLPGNWKDSNDQAFVKRGLQAAGLGESLLKMICDFNFTGQTHSRRYRRCPR